MECFQGAFLTYLGMRCGYINYEIITGSTSDYPNHASFADSLSIEPQTLAIVVMVFSLIAMFFGIEKLLQVVFSGSKKHKGSESA